MITTILKRETCSKCLICCRYTNDDIWDAPGFTKEELRIVLKKKNYNYYFNNQLYYLEMEKDNTDEYICPLLSDTGCKLGTNKPFKCAIWPLYVINYNNKIAIAVSDVCPSLNKLSDQEILHGIKSILNNIRVTIKRYPELIESYRDNFRIITYLEI